MSNLVWVDLETTGLDTERDDLLEVAVIVTDQNLVMLDEPFTTVVFPTDGWTDRLLANSYVRDMHTKNGLRTDVEALYDLNAQESVEYTRWSIDGKLRDWLRQFGDENTMPLAGSTISFDRAVMQKHLSRTERYLHYRNVDVSTVKRCVQMWYPEVYRDYVDNYQSTDKAHRALTDLRESIAELAHYKEHVFDVAKLAVPV